MTIFLRILSGAAVYELADRFFEKYFEPRLRQRANEEGFLELFEQELCCNRRIGRAHASAKAFWVGRERARQNCDS